VIQHNVALRERCWTHPTRNEHYVGAGWVMGALRLPWLRCAAGRRGSALGAAWRTARRLALLRTSRPCFGFHSVAALPGGAGCCVNPRPTSTPKQKPFLRHGA
ncbi:hypothetical protein, partial [Pectobacterium atrosepticum]|uniref:hypothetical protein n=1 Tax=Pectobacterium atrosepticum TaxID=29471 RepID=UPI001CF3DB27